VIKYLGSKRTLLPAIVPKVASALEGLGLPPGRGTVVDLFSGTSRVGHALKAAGYRVLANDHNAYAATLARCYIAADDDLRPDAERLVAEFNRLPGAPGYFTETFCVRSRYLRPENGARVDAVREAIAAKGLPPDLEAVMLTALMEAADRVDSTTGLQMAYLKRWSPRSGNGLELRVPALLPRAASGKGEAHRLDAEVAAGLLEGDVVYLDPPYNQHSYLGNYHVWESLVVWDKPPVYGVACKREDVRARRSAFNSRRGFAGALARTLAAVRASAVVVSLSDEGFMPPESMRAALSGLWGGCSRVTVTAHDFPRYVGARIGIYNPRGEKVGRVGRLRNTEHILTAVRAGSASGEVGGGDGHGQAEVSAVGIILPVGGDQDAAGLEGGPAVGAGDGPEQRGAGEPAGEERAGAAALR
jgi:adenine-specific DNA-methyltransferase